MGVSKKGECFFCSEADLLCVGLESGAEEPGDLKSDVPGQIPWFGCIGCWYPEYWSD